MSETFSGLIEIKSRKFLNVISKYYKGIIEGNTTSGNYALANFDSIYSSVNIDCVRCENCQHDHVDIIKDSQIDQWA